MPSLTQQRCLNHSFREAVARCPECQRFYCRECITEHEDRVLCAGCIKKLTRPAARGGFRLANVVVTLQCLLGVLTAWLFFYCVGRVVLAIPDSFHEGTVWKSRFLDEE
jgi:hypothetical protein